MKDYPIDAYIQTCSVANNTQIKSIHKFTEYLEELEKKQKPEPVHRVANLVKKLLPVPFSPVRTVSGRTFIVPPLNLPKFLTSISNLFITPTFG
jgi:hypothetical protein